MYCVKCGVRLQSGEERCPLCGTPLWNPDEAEPKRGYPDALPQQSSEADLSGAAVMSVLSALAAVVVLIVCLRLYGAIRWGGYAMLGVALFWVVAVLPRFFARAHGEIFVPVDHAAAALYLLYICLRTGGRWFLSFALPVLGASCLLSTAMICLLKYLRGGRLYLFGGFLILLGLFTVLVEFLQHVSFGTEMFLWSLYSLAAFAAAGLFLLLAGMIPPLRRALERRFFF